MSGDLDDAASEGAISERIGRIASQMEGSDFERIDPPAGLWERIEAAVAADPALAPKEPPARGVGAGTVVEYRIDADDVVTDTAEAWDDFARDNDAAELAGPGQKRSLWSYFDRPEIRELWQLLVERVRATAAEARVPLRCDGPDARRWFEMTVTPEADGRVRFRSVLVFEEARPHVALLDPRSDRDALGAPVPVCSWCGRAQHGSDWVDIEELVRAERLFERSSLPPISYGICSSCRNDMSAERLVPGAHEHGN